MYNVKFTPTNYYGTNCFCIEIEEYGFHGIKENIMGIVKFLGLYLGTVPKGYQIKKKKKQTEFLSKVHLEKVLLASNILTFKKCLTSKD